MYNKDFYNKGWEEWNTIIDNSPAPFHRRRIIKNIIIKNVFKNKTYSIADFGCGNGTMLSYINSFLNDSSTFHGFDISSEVIDKNKSFYRNFFWTALDINTDIIDDKFDFVICSEVLEHLNNWEDALTKLINATKKMCIITVPSSRIFQIDKMVGHYTHFNKKMIYEILKDRTDIKYNVFYWGFPFHQLYKYLMNLFPQLTYSAFTKKKYSFKELLVSSILNFVFYFNLKTKFKTSQMFIIIERIK